ncbi:39S ribosomal protein L45, mitochondrial-like [Triticum dicoccoides]|uniref:39S ribosomal protein L45, mitochondrial-like n=1 Tax=Triticum dicoccoides TaxID=85692 RepID=UPI00188F77F3|nr:39S ribosomal protein L45, mitochondrial-like [Triticum dicoccoides]
MSLARLGQSLARRLHRPLHLPPPPPPDHYATVSRSFAPIHANTCARGFATLTYNYNGGGVISGKFGGPSHVHAAQVLELVVHLNHARPMSSGAGAAPKPPSLSEGVSFGGYKVALKADMPSPGFVFEPYRVPEPIPLWKRLFTPSGWSRTKEDAILQFMNAFTVSRLRKKIGYNKKQFQEQAFNIYKEVNKLIARGDIPSLQKALTDDMHSTVKNEIRKRQSKWKSVHWELVEPAVSIRTLRARMISLDKNDLNKAYVQLTLEFITKQKFEAYNTKREVVSGDKSKEVLVKDIWVFERSLFHPGAYWRVCARITL